MEFNDSICKNDKKHVEKDDRETWDEDHSNPATPMGHFKWQTNQKQKDDIDQQMFNPWKRYQSYRSPNTKQQLLCGLLSFSLSLS